MGGHSPFVATPVAADTEMLVDRIRGIALMAAALSCGRRNKQRNDSSLCTSVHHGVPQGSVLGPILFTRCMLSLTKIIQRLGRKLHC